VIALAPSSTDLIFRERQFARGPGMVERLDDEIYEAAVNGRDKRVKYLTGGLVGRHDGDHVLRVNGLRTSSCWRLRVLTAVRRIREAPHSLHRASVEAPPWALEIPMIETRGLAGFLQLRELEAELDRLRKIEAAARAFIEAEDSPSETLVVDGRYQAAINALREATRSKS
jgi:hypothetical protein